MRGESRASAQRRGTSGRIPELDGLRALAFSLVFGYHTWQFAGQPAIPVVSSVIAQNTRPDFFVVLTGFLLTMPFARHLGRLSAFRVRPFLRRRLRRIVLPYYAALLFAVLLPQALVVLVRLFGRSANFQPVPSLADWLWHLSFLQLFSADQWASINGSLWTMSLEMQLYFLFPVVLLLGRRWGVRGVAGALAVSLLYRVVAGLAVAGAGFPVEFLVAANGLGRLCEFLAGATCAFFVFRNPSGPTRAERWLLGAGMVGGYAVAVSPLDQLTWLSVRELSLGLGLACLIALVVRNRPIARAFGSRVPAWFGYRSYSLFLVHQPLMWFFSEFLVKLLHTPDGVVKLVVLWTVGLAITVVVGQVFFRLIEQPCIAWSKRTPTIVPSPVLPVFSGRRRGPTSPSSVSRGAIDGLPPRPERPAEPATPGTDASR